MRLSAGVPLLAVLLFVAPATAHADIIQGVQDTLTTDVASGVYSQDLGNEVSGLLTEAVFRIHFNRIGQTYPSNFSLDIYACNDPAYTDCPSVTGLGYDLGTLFNPWIDLGTEGDTVLSFSCPTCGVTFDPAKYYRIQLVLFTFNGLGGATFRVYGSADDTYPYGNTSAGGLGDMAFELHGMTHETAEPPAPSVLFIPGLKGSRLYQNVSDVEERRWEPGFFQSDVLALYLNQFGQSINSVYTNATGTIARTDFPIVGLDFNIDIYRTFFGKLDALKSSGDISDWTSFPYDWRQDPVDVVENGTPYNDGLHFIEDEVERLSQDGSKVILVGHSNGGLVAKALMRKLEAEGIANLVSKVILVATPQVGTPDAISAMLHGDGQAIPSFGGPVRGQMVSSKTARGLAEHMPDAYVLLPSPAYFSAVSEPVVDLTNAPVLRAQAGISGNTISSEQELASFITGAGGRPKPAANDLVTPNVLSSLLLSQQTAVHANLDSWTPPPGIEVIQIAGWGIETPQKVVYRESPKTFCIPATSICAVGPVLRYEVTTTKNGDDTVVSSSATANQAWTTFFLNMRQYNFDERRSAKHLDITEIPSFQILFQSLIGTTTFPLPNYITTTIPTFSNPSTRLAVLSPVSIDVYDNQGRHVGIAPSQPSYPELTLIDEEIPNSYYWQFGEEKYVGIPTDSVYSIELHGLDTGTFTLQVDTLLGDTVQDTVTFEDIPVTASTTATLTVTNGEITTPLTLDINGDGTADTTITSPDQTTDPLTYSRLIKTNVSVMSLGASLKSQLLDKLSDLEKYIADNNLWDPVVAQKKARIADKIKTQITIKVSAIEDLIKNAVASNDIRITPSQAEALLDMLYELKQITQ